MAEKRIVTGQFVRIKQTPAKTSERILGAVIDWVLIFAWFYLLELLIGASSFFDVLDLGTVGLLLSLPAVVYQPLCEYLMHGQTLGKFLMRTRVVMVDGGRPSIAAYLLRWLLLPIDVIFFGSVAAFTMLVTRHRQRLGDLAAGTMVIKLRSYAKARVPLDEFQFVSNDYQPVYPEADRLTEADATLIAHALGDHSTSRQHRQRQLAQRIRRDYAIGDADARHARQRPEDFLSRLLSDYRYYDLTAV